MANIARELYGEENAYRRQTADATPTVVATIDLPPTSVGSLGVLVLARTAGGVRASWRIVANGGREAGVPTAIAPPVNGTVQKDAGAAAWDVSLVITGNSIGVQVTGVAATVIDWLVVTSEYILAPGL